MPRRQQVCAGKGGHQIAVVSATPIALGLWPHLQYTGLASSEVARIGQVLNGAVQFAGVHFRKTAAKGL